MKIKTCISQKPLGPFLTKFCMKAFGYMEIKSYEHDAGHMKLDHFKLEYEVLKIPNYSSQIFVFLFVKVKK